MHQSYLSLLGMAAFTNAIGPDVLQMLGGLPGAGKHSQAATQEAASLTTAAPKYSDSAKAHGNGHAEDKSDVAEDYTLIYISSGTEVVEMATTTLYYPLSLRDASVPSATGAVDGSAREWAPTEADYPQEEDDEEFEPSATTFALRSTTSSSLLIATPTAPALGDAAPANPLGSLPILGSLGGGLPVKRGSSSATGAGDVENEQEEDSSSATGAIGSEGDEWWHEAEEEDAFSSTLAFRSSTTSSSLIATPTLPAVGTPAAANPLGSLPVLGGLGGGLGGGLPVKRDSSSATGAGNVEHEEEEDSSSATGAIGGFEHEWAPEEEEVAKEPEATTFKTFIRSSTSSTLALPVATPAASNPLGSLPVLGGLGGLKKRQIPVDAIQSLAHQAAQAQASEVVASATQKAGAAYSSATKKAAAAAASATKASSPLRGLPPLGSLGGLKERQVSDDAETSDLADDGLAAATQSAGNDIASATTKAKSTDAAATKAASPLQGLPVLGGLGGLGGI